MTWTKPELVKLETAELLCKVRVKADSTMCTSGQYLDEAACSHLEVGDTWGDGGDEFDAPCGILTQCIMIGPLFGCDSGLACSVMAPVFR